MIVRSEAVFQTVLELEMIHRENRHGALRLKAVAGWTDEDLAQECTWQDTQITVLREGEEDAPLFSGTLSCLSFDRSEGVLEIRGLGGSVAMDREKRRRSFQNGKRTYHDIVREVMEGYPEGACIWNAGEDGETGGPLIQYEETDWEFLIRLCSHFGQPLFADLKTGRPQFFFGMGQGQRRSLEESRITGTGFDNSYYHNGCYENGLTREAAFYLDVETTQYWQMGDSVLWQDRIWRVYERRICLMGGALQCAYVWEEKGPGAGRSCTIPRCGACAWKGRSAGRRRNPSGFNWIWTNGKAQTGPGPGRLRQTVSATACRSRGRKLSCISSQRMSGKGGSFLQQWKIPGKAFIPILRSGPLLRPGENRRGCIRTDSF